MAHLIRGDKLTVQQAAQVKAAYVNCYYSRSVWPTYEEWLAGHAFYFIKDGSRLSLRHHHCELAWMAD